MNDTQRYKKNLIHFLTKIDRPEFMAAVLNDLLTPGELAEIAKRLEIITLLKRGVSQRAISQQLGVGIATVTRGARLLATSKHWQ
ncbi:MAG: Trp family transcriptional regulator [Patescibacteria group bacterium]